MRGLNGRRLERERRVGERERKDKFEFHKELQQIEVERWGIARRPPYVDAGLRIQDSVCDKILLQSEDRSKHIYEGLSTKKNKSL